MGETIHDCRMLVFVRPSTDKPDVGLRRRLQDFLLTGNGTASLDDRRFSAHHRGGKIADYLLWDSQFITEVKEIQAFPAAAMTRLVNDELRLEPRMFVFGSADMQQVMKDRKNADEFYRKMASVGGRPVRKMLQIADPQIRSTREKLCLTGSAGLVIILIDEPQKIDAGTAAYAARDALQAIQPALEEIDFVWISIEAHKVALPDGRVGYPEVCVWRAGRRPESDRLMMGKMIDAWAQFNGAEIEHLDHTTGGDALNPLGEGWPLHIQLH
jgi:hypothetical protein